jgi:hypothetical protein
LKKRKRNDLLVEREKFRIRDNTRRSITPEDELIKRSDFTIVNDGKTLLLPQILEIHNKLKEQV